jgi:hypothetical protein
MECSLYRELKPHARFEVSMEMTMKNAIFWDIKTLFVPQRQHSMTPLLSPTG